MELKLNLLLFLAENKLTRVSKTLIKKALQKRAYFNLAQSRFVYLVTNKN
jgi:hypothetical protein